MTHPSHRAEDMPTELRESILDMGRSVAQEAWRMAAAEERARIVAWLRDDCPGCPYVAEYAIADAIERGEHDTHRKTAGPSRPGQS